MERAALSEQVESTEWYHTLELAPGVVTPGWFDTRAVISTLESFPRSLAGKRCLDVGTFDGFWAFSMEQRGAAEVVAVDLLDPLQWDWPENSSAEAIAAIGKRKGSGSGYEIAHHALGSSVTRHEISAYDLHPDLVGTFDFVYLGSILLHLRDPVRALTAVRSVCRPTGNVLSVDAIDLQLTITHPRQPAATLDGAGRPWWWRPNVAGLVRMTEVAGFTAIGKPQRFFMPPGRGQPLAKLKPKMVWSKAGRDLALTIAKGDAHASVLLKPAR